MMKNKKGAYAPLWIFVAVFFFLFLIALIEPFKPFLSGALLDLDCDNTTNGFILPVCWLIKGVMFLFIGITLYEVIQWIIRRSQ